MYNLNIDITTESQFPPFLISRFLYYRRVGKSESRDSETSPQIPDRSDPTGILTLYKEKLKMQMFLEIVIIT